MIGIPTRNVCANKDTKGVGTTRIMVFLALVLAAAATAALVPSASAHCQKWDIKGKCIEGKDCYTFPAAVDNGNVDTNQCGGCEEDKHMGTHWWSYDGGAAGRFQKICSEEGEDSICEPHDSFVGVLFGIGAVPFNTDLPVDEICEG